ncbi:GNAT family N-acetyltransferase [Paenibacillus thailandensis]|uniref:GNAT family N-acetyltransferase n=1 Tax=Paenibacillus thailandensis TaxID=393250 RepID=A0ABW5R1J7_9BACL
MAIRLYGRDDFHKCVNTFIGVFNQEPWNDEWSEASAEQYLRDYTDTPGFMGVVAEEAGEIYGFIFGCRKRWWSGEEFYVHEMCVSKAKQNAGIGSNLLTFLEKRLQAGGAARITLLTDKGIPAEAFYKKNGFVQVERLIFLSKKI